MNPHEELSNQEILEFRGCLQLRNGDETIPRYVLLHENNLAIYLNKNYQQIERTIPLTTETKVDINVNETPYNIVVRNPGSDPITFEFTKKKKTVRWGTAITNSLTVSPILSMASFRILSTIGRGFFGKVMLVQHRTTGELFAIKSIQKKRLIETSKINTVIAERNILMKAKHPFLVRLCFSFQTSSKFYLGLEYASGGELFYHMEKRGAIPIDEARLYIAEIALALNYLHSIGIIYRDLKPENVLLDSEGHIKLTDFGLSKELVESNSTATTICGTTEYLAPEVILRQPYSYAVDWWALGVLAYEMLTDGNPFLDDNRGKTLQNIVRAVPYFPPGMLPKDAVDFIRLLLTKDPQLRPGFNRIKKMKFFSSLNWDDVYNKKYTPAFIPENKGNITANFDPEFTTENPVDSAVQSASCNFPDFSFTGTL